MKNKKDQKIKRSKEEAEKYYYEKYYKDYDRKKSFFEKPLEIFAILIVFGLISFTVNSIKEFYNYSLNKNRLDQLIKQENQDLIFSKVCNDYILDVKNSGGKISDCDPEKILREDIEKSMFSFLLPDEYMQKTETKALDNITVKKLSNETKPIKSNCIEGNCINGFGKKQYSNAYYIGEFKNKKENGQGTLVFDNGDKYVGGWSNGKKNDQGTYLFANGDQYIGSWMEDKKHGVGTYRYSSGAKYDGGWKYGMKYGEGVFIWPDGDKYFGGFYNGKRHGNGVFVWADNTIHSGYFYEGEISNGFQLNPDGTKLILFKKEGKLVAKKVEEQNQNLDLILQQLKRKNDIQTSKILLDISNNLMKSNQSKSSMNIINSNLGGGFLSGSSSSGMYRTCSYSSSLGTKTKTVFASAPCPMAY
jgi:hypothetical protein